ncbi:MAG TPA: hypothetical protein VIC55_01185 [Gemmatimonadaceae bacterium]|jgi:signal transduction histidine kinase
MRDDVSSDRAQEYATLIDEIARVMGARLQEAQLPLHILLSSPFGALNENQEEMLSAAQAAVDAADMELRRLRKLVELDRGALAPVVQPIGLAELLRPVLAIGQARAEQNGVQLRTEISDRAPRVMADAMLAQDALTTVLGGAIASTARAGDVLVRAGEREDGSGGIVIEITHGASSDAESLEMRLARRLLSVQRATLTEHGEYTRIDLPAERSLRAGTQPP